nr:peptide ABC transporter substrate-binding protein [Rubeoparvulum massiliense]
MKRKSSWWLLVVLCIIFVVSGCTTGKTTDGTSDPKGSANESPTDPGKEAAQRKVLILNNGDEPTSFDPPIAFDEVSYNILNNLMEGLTRLGADHTPHPAMAKDWKLSEDGRVYTFYLREDAKWSNGEPVTAHDFEYAWKRIADPEVASTAAFLTYNIEGAEAFNNGEGTRDEMQVKALDATTLEVKLRQPQGYFLHIASMPVFFPVHQATAEANADWHKNAVTFVSNGPFKLKEWVHEEKMIAEKNEHYWDVANVKLDEVVWHMISDGDTEYQMYQAGQLHTSGVPGDLADQLATSAELVIAPQSGTYFYRFNLTMEPFQNQKIRQAFSMAIDREQITKFIVKGGVEPAYGFVSTGFLDSEGQDFRQTNGALIKFDPAEAKRLLEEGMKEEGYTTLPPVTLTYNTSDAHKQIAEAMQQMIKEHLGIEMKLENTEWKVHLAAQKALELQFNRSSFLADYADPINYLEGYRGGDSMNRTGWSNATYDQLLNEILAATDEKQRFELMYQAEKILMEESPILPLYFYNRNLLQKPEVTGIVRHPVGYLELKWADLP